jgi:hypothetical protein
MMPVILEKGYALPSEHSAPVSKVWQLCDALPQLQPFCLFVFPALLVSKPPRLALDDPAHWSSKTQG